MNVKNKSRHVVSLLGVLLFLIFAVGSVDDSGSSSSSSSKSSSSKSNSSRPKTRTEIIEQQFSAWDGSHRSLTKLIKESMNDPDSYDHVETVYWDKGDHLIVRTTFRGKNAFGGVVKNWVKAKVDLNGNVIEVIEQGP